MTRYVTRHTKMLAHFPVSSSAEIYAYYIAVLFIFCFISTSVAEGRITKGVAGSVPLI